MFQFKFLVDNVWRVDDRLYCCQDNAYGTISNCIMVTEQGLVNPIVESFSPAIVTENEVPQPMTTVTLARSPSLPPPHLALPPPLSVCLGPQLEIWVIVANEWLACWFCVFISTQVTTVPISITSLTLPY